LVLSGVFVAALLAVAALAVASQVSLIREYRGSWAVFEADHRTPAQMAATASTHDDWVYLANLNIYRGGPVWPELAGFYGDAGR
jgi:hypothetical protein